MHESKEQKEARLEKAAAKSSKQAVASNKLLKSDPARYHYLRFTIFMVKKLFPQSWAEDEDFRLMQEAFEGFPKMHSKKVKHYLMELYLHLVS